jgi:hypothetical protein
MNFKSIEVYNDAAVIVSIKHKQAFQKMHTKKVYVGLKEKNKLEILENWSILKEKNKIVFNFL